jgi:hypothetical protein
METQEISLLKKSNFTKNYMKLINNLNSKLDEKISELSDRIVEEFENKKKELLEMKEQLDEYNKIQHEITGLNNFYDSTLNKKPNLVVEQIAHNPSENNPYVTNKNLITHIDKTNISIRNGDLLKKSVKTNFIELANANELKNSDALLSNLQRLVLKKQTTMKSIDTNKVLVESESTEIVIDFAENQVKPTDVFLRYHFMPHENRQSFSYINSLFGSNDGKSWELIGTMNPMDVRLFERLPIVKFPILYAKPTDTFYRYLLLEVNRSKDNINSNVVKTFNKIQIPICGIEVYGEYSNESSLIEKLDERFDEFFDVYINKNFSELSDRSEPKFLVKLLHETYKELYGLIATYKSKLELGSIIKNILGDGSEKVNEVEKEKRLVNELKRELDELNTMTERIESELQEELEEQEETQKEEEIEENTATSTSVANPTSKPSRRKRKSISFAQ